jgi:hypothetical protein
MGLTLSSGQHENQFHWQAANINKRRRRQGPGRGIFGRLMENHDFRTGMIAGGDATSGGEIEERRGGREAIPIYGKRLRSTGSENNPGFRYSIFHPDCSCLCPKRCADEHQSKDNGNLESATQILIVQLHIPLASRRASLPRRDLHRT